MPTYYVNEAAFTLPERGFVDGTIHRLESPLSGASPLAVAIRRVPIEQGQSLRALVDQEIATTRAEVKSFTVLDEAEVAVAGAPAILLRARFRTEDEVHYQLQGHIAYGDTWIGIIATAPYTAREACDETFDRVVQSLKWRGG
jgi:hypothetical protein